MYTWNAICPSPYGPLKRNKAFGGECSLQSDAERLWASKNFGNKIILLSHSAKVKCLRLFITLGNSLWFPNANCLPILEVFNLHHPGKFGVPGFANRLANRNKDDWWHLVFRMVLNAETIKRMGCLSIFVSCYILIFHLNPLLYHFQQAQHPAPQHPGPREFFARRRASCGPDFFALCTKTCTTSVVTAKAAESHDQQSNDQPCPRLKSCMISQSLKDEYINRKTGWAEHSNPLNFPCKKKTTVFQD